MDISFPMFLGQGPKKQRKVWFTGSTALRMGQGLCYDLDYYSSKSGEAVTDPLGFRGNYVAVSDTTNNLAFAGVTDQAYPAKSGGQLITINMPVPDR